MHEEFRNSTLVERILLDANLNRLSEESGDIEELQLIADLYLTRKI
jgi:hypothetical protein